MTRFIAVLLALGAILTIAACVPSQTSGTEVVVFKVNDRDITAAELLKSPMVRQAVKQYLVTDALLREAGKAGIYADEEEIDEQMKQIEQDAISQDLTLEEYLTKKQYVTVEEVRESMRMSQLFEKLVESKVTITDEERLAFWNERQDEIKYTYARENHLTEAEVGDLSMETVKDTLDELIRRDKVGQTRTDLLNQLTNSIEVKLVAVADPEEAKLYEDLLINNSKILEEEAEPEPTTETPPTPPETGGATGSLQPAPEGAGEGTGEGTEPGAGEGEGEGDGTESPAEPPAEPGGAGGDAGAEGAGK